MFLLGKAETKHTEKLVRSHAFAIVTNPENSIVFILDSVLLGVLRVDFDSPGLALPILSIINQFRNGAKSPDMGGGIRPQHFWIGFTMLHLSIGSSIVSAIN